LLALKERVFFSGEEWRGLDGSGPREWGGEKERERKLLDLFELNNGGLFQLRKNRV